MDVDSKMTVPESRDAQQVPKVVRSTLSPEQRARMQRSMLEAAERRRLLTMGAGKQRIEKKAEKLLKQCKEGSVIPSESTGVLIVYLTRVQVKCLCCGYFTRVLHKRRYVTSAAAEGYARRSLTNHIQAVHPRAVSIATVVHKTHPDAHITDRLRDILQKMGEGAIVKG